MNNEQRVKEIAKKVVDCEFRKSPHGFILFAKSFALDMAEKSARVALNTAIPEGYVLVPEEPTEEMLLAGMDKMEDFVGRYINIISMPDVYKAMLSAIKGDKE